MFSEITISHDEFKASRQEMRSAIKQLASREHSKNEELSNLKNNIKQLLNMAEQIKVAIKDRAEIDLKHFCEYEHESKSEYAREIKRKKVIIEVLWPIYKSTLNSLSQK